MSDEAVLYEKKDNVAVITLNRPEKRNVMGGETSEGMRNAFDRVQKDGDVRVVILTGTGTAFCAGVDLKDTSIHAESSVTRHLGMEDAAGTQGYGESRKTPWDHYPRPAAPVIAAVNGYCYGVGIEIALWCDIVIASDRAKFGLQHIKWGIYSGGGGTPRLATIAGKMQGMYHALTGESFDAQEALSMGVASKVVPHDQLMEFTEEKAKIIAQWSPLAVRYTKECIYEAVEHPLRPVAQTDQYRLFTLYSTGDREEGQKAFAEKRDASYKGK